MSTPSRMPHQRRSIAEVRRSRLSGLGTSRTPQRYAWERGSTITATPNTGTPRPTDSNADRRFAKLEKLRQLERELRDLKKDEDVIEMESHKRKRVKVDQLAYIPHNRPGDSEGTFRVPDIDSDDEMEVEYSVPERTNVFEEASKAPLEVPRMVEREREIEHVTAHVPVVVSEWKFPSVGKRLAGDVLSHAAEEAAREKFVMGFQAWKELYGY